MQAKTAATIVGFCSAALFISRSRDIGSPGVPDRIPSIAEPNSELMAFFRASGVCTENLIRVDDVVESLKLAK